MCPHLCIDFESLSPLSALEKGPILERDPCHFDSKDKTREFSQRQSLRPIFLNHSDQPVFLSGGEGSPAEDHHHPRGLRGILVA